MMAFGMTFTIITSVLFWSVMLVVLMRILREGGLRATSATRNMYKRGLSYRPKRPFRINPRVHSTRPYLLHIRLQRLRQAHKRIIRMPALKPLTLKKHTKPSSGLVIFLFSLGVRLAFLAGVFVLLWVQTGYSPGLAAVFDASLGWDNYAMIAQRGYAYTEEGQNLYLVFFPLYIYLIRIVALVVRDHLAAAFIVAFASYSAGVYYLHRLVRLDFSNSTAWWAVVLISIAPVGFFFGSPMTESLMLLTSAATLYYIRTHRWALAGVAGALASFTRLVGILLVLAAIVEFVTHYKFIELVRKARWDYVWSLVSGKGLWIFVMPVGTLTYLFINWYVSGNPFQFVHYQSTHWHNHTQYFGRTIYSQFNILTLDISAEAAHGVHLPNILAFAFGITLLVYGCLKKHNAAYIVYALGYIMVSFAPSWLLAGARYMLVCLPLFIFLAEFVDKKPLRAVVVTALFVAGLLPLFSIFVRGGWVF